MERLEEAGFSLRLEENRSVSSRCAVSSMDSGHGRITHPSKLKRMIQTLFGSLEPEKKTPDNPDAQEPALDGEPKKNFFDRMRRAVSRTRETFSAKISDLAALTRTVDESALEELETALLSSDLGVPTTTAILEALQDRKSVM
jgi:signal recognition particle GTPase